MINPDFESGYFHNRLRLEVYAIGDENELSDEASGLYG